MVGWRIERSGWLIPVAVLIGGALIGGGLAASFVALHSNWNRLAWVTPDAQSTAPYWFVEGLIPIVVSVGWTALVLRARGHRRWFLLSGALAVAEIALLSFALIPVAIAGNGGVWATDVGFPALVLVLPGGPIAAGAWPFRGKLSSVRSHIVAGIALPVGLYVSFTATGNALGA